VVLFFVRLNRSTEVFIGYLDVVGVRKLNGVPEPRCHDMGWQAFDTLLEAKVLIERWRQHYNTLRPHSALGYRPPAPEARQPCAVAEA